MGVNEAVAPPEPTLRTYAQVLRRRKWWLAATAAVVVVGTLAYVMTQPKQYSATAQLLVQPENPGVTQSGSAQQITPTDVLTELQLVTSAPVKAAVTKQLGTAPDISATQVGQTNVIAVTATASTPARASTVANAYATAFVTYRRTVTIDNLTAAETQLEQQISSIDTQIHQLQPDPAQAAQVTALATQEAALKDQLAQLQVSGAVTTGGIEVVTPATPPGSPSSPRPSRDALVAVVLGLLLGMGVAFTVEYVDDTVYLKDEVERLAPGVPVLALVPMDSSWKDRAAPQVSAVAAPRSTVTESYRALRTSLQFAAQQGDLRTILVTSASDTEGKSATVANLGVVLANAGERVVVVSCDLRKPRLASFFGLDESVGLTSVLLGHTTLDGALQAVPGVANLSLLGTGPLPPDPAELVASGALARLLGDVAARADVVLVDSPPVLPVTDAAVLARVADGTLLVVASGQSRGKELRRALEGLSLVDARLVGIVLNEVSRSTGYGYGYARPYGYGGGDPVAGGHGPGGGPSTGGTTVNGAAHGVPVAADGVAAATNGNGHGNGHGNGVGAPRSVPDPTVSAAPVATGTPSRRGTLPGEPPDPVERAR